MNAFLRVLEVVATMKRPAYYAHMNISDFTIYYIAKLYMHGLAYEYASFKAMDPRLF